MEWWGPNSSTAVGSLVAGTSASGGQVFTAPLSCQTTFHSPPELVVHPIPYPSGNPLPQPSYPPSTSHSTEMHSHYAPGPVPRSSQHHFQQPLHHPAADAYYQDERHPSPRANYHREDLATGPVRDNVFVLPHPARPNHYAPPSAPPLLPAVPSAVRPNYGVLPPDFVPEQRRYTEPFVGQYRQQDAYDEYPPPPPLGRHSYSGPDSSSTGVRPPAGPVYWSRTSTPTPFWTGDATIPLETSTHLLRPPLGLEYGVPVQRYSNSAPPSRPLSTTPEFDNLSRRTSSVSDLEEGGRSKYRHMRYGEEEDWSEEEEARKKRPRRQRLASGGSESSASQVVRKFACDICGQRFARPSALATHTFTHTKEKPFSCSTCDRHFAVMSNLRRHCRVRKHDMEAADRQRAKLQEQGKPASEEAFFDVLFQRERTMSAPSRGRTVSTQSNLSTRSSVSFSGGHELERHSVG